MSGSHSSSSTRIKDITPEEYKALRAPTAARLAEFLNASGFDYGGPLAAGMTGDEVGSLARLNDTSGRLNPELENLILRTAGGEFLQDVPNNPFLGGAIDFVRRQVEDAFDLESAQNRSLFSRAGHKISQSSPFSDAQSRLEIDRQDRLADQIAGLALPLFEAERARMNEASTRGVELVNSQLANLEANALPRMIADLGVERGQQLFTDRLNRLIQAFSILGDVTSQFMQRSSSKSSSGGVL